ncbi:tRNA glutamyl-Q(34) synthetase GluQRS [Lacibacterium aquatile]|uniref:tRNA glutamyl-Q(34) synthetase GluQRS n=1 Tax=Lacibacterium aquatile TaxID=1168082 RepID=A0ABW5DX11_9PROT
MNRTRFAPSPTGFLHLGHALAALYAEAAGEEMLVRVEDIDTTRCRPEFDAAIFEDLAWLGIRWTGPVWRQSERFDAYRAALAHLEDQSLLYPCFCTRKEIQAEIAGVDAAPHGPDGPLYPGTCRHLSTEERAEKLAADRPYALRIDMERAIAATARPLTFREHGVEIVSNPEQFGDAILARKETPTSYHLAVTVDDAAQGVTLVTRAEDLLPATHLHRLLQALLDLPTPDYRHFPLLKGADGKRLAKRDGAKSLRELRTEGVSPEDVRRQLGF